MNRLATPRIRLPAALLLAAALAPASRADLVAYYSLDGNLRDSSGNDYTLTADAPPQFDRTHPIAGHSALAVRGQAMTKEDYPWAFLSQLPKLRSPASSTHMSVTAWVRTTNDANPGSGQRPSGK